MRDWAINGVFGLAWCLIGTTILCWIAIWKDLNVLMHVSGSMQLVIFLLMIIFGSFI
jgi:hypothetical protein